MQRRSFLGLLAAVVVPPADPSPTFGYLTPEIVTARGYDNTRVRVFFDGRDVTSLNQVIACDDREGWIEVLAKDWTGNYRRDPHDPTKVARERRYGSVRVTLGAPA